MPKTLDEGFSAFLTRLVPLETEHNKAISHKGSVKSCLEKNFACYNFFETGSFGNGTGIRHYSDTDYFGVIPSRNLFSSSVYSLRKVKEALQDTFWQTKDIEVRSPAVRIPFGQYSSETLELIPCTFNGLIETSIGKHDSYYIPDGDDGWMTSSPTAHNAYVRKQDERLGYKLKPLIRLIKAWKYYNNVPISSFYLELRVAKYAEDEKAIVYDIDLFRIMRMLNSNGLASIQDPMGISGLVKACKSEVTKNDAISKTYTGFTRAEKANNEREDNLDKCFSWWDLFFNYKFPAR